MKVLYDTTTYEHWVCDTDGTLYWHHDQWMSLEQLQALNVDEATEYDTDDYLEYNNTYTEVKELDAARRDEMNNYNTHLTEDYDPDDEDFEDEEEYLEYKCRWLKRYSEEIASIDAEYDELYEQIEAQ